jgi:hypothetical protein
MYYNGKHGKPVSVFLKNVHTQMTSKYKDQNSTATQEAKELQQFFQDLKNVAREGFEGKSLLDMAI